MTFLLRDRALTRFRWYRQFMPAKPRWHADVAKIRRTVASMTSTPFLDRAVIERLFGVRARQANYLMRGLGGFKTGSSSMVSREDLLLKLDQMAAPRGGPNAEIERKTRVVETLDALKRDARPRRIAPPPPRLTRDPLPPGARISAPGELTILFSSPDDLLGRIMFLLQSANSDFASFADGLAAGALAPPTQNKEP
jgi:hypothetical protein